jgi:hypothetical protein
MSMSLLTWANLNHGLCGHHSDPVYVLLGLGKWYWLVAEIYLILASLLFGYGINFLVISAVHKVLKLVNSKDTTEEVSSKSE